VSSPRALYVHIPFCEHLCAYCDFAKVLYRPDWAFSYVAELKKECASYSLGQVDTLYLGGGTPSVLSPALLTDLLAFLKPHLAPGGEFTVEGNPENLDREKLQLFREAGVNRLSLGVESSSPRLLSLMKRHHTFAQARETVEEAKRLGFSRINCDLIYGLPDESSAELEADLSALLSLQVGHLSTYCLTIHPGTAFFNAKYREMGEDEAADSYERILKRLRDAGYDRYEVSNFAKPGEESRHNLVYWHDEPYYGLGMGASGYVGGVHYDNTRSLKRYLAGSYRASEERETPKDALEYYFLTNLRLEKGFRLSAFEQKFGFPFLEKYASAVASLKEKGWLVVGSDRVACSDRGLLLLDQVLLALY
jgi:oxygen-independent coproporphyrinogen-3 oxidase